MSLDPENNDEVEVRVRSDSDPVGIRLGLQETKQATGIFGGTVFLPQDSHQVHTSRYLKGIA